jgi:hypothetical protein
VALDGRRDRGAAGVLEAHAAGAQPVDIDRLVEHEVDAAIHRHVRRAGGRVRRDQRRPLGVHRHRLAGRRDELEHEVRGRRGHAEEPEVDRAHGLDREHALGRDRRADRLDAEHGLREHRVAQRIDSVHGEVEREVDVQRRAPVLRPLARRLVRVPVHAPAAVGEQLDLELARRQPDRDLAAELHVEPARAQPLAAPDRERDRPAQRLRIAELGRHRARLEPHRLVPDQRLVELDHVRLGAGARRLRARVARQPRAQHLRDRAGRAAGPLRHEVEEDGRQRLPAEIGDPVAEPELVGRARRQILLRIDRDVDALGEDRRGHRGAAGHELDRARAGEHRPLVEGLAEHELERRGLDQRARARVGELRRVAAVDRDHGRRLRARPPIPRREPHQRPGRRQVLGERRERWLDEQLVGRARRERPGQELDAPALADDGGGHVDRPVGPDEAEPAPSPGVARAERTRVDLVGERHDDARARRDIELAVDGEREHDARRGGLPRAVVAARGGRGGSEHHHLQAGRAKGDHLLRSIANSRGRR